MAASARVAVIGAGPAGLCAAQHSQTAGLSCTVFEQSGDIGGTWQYTDCVGIDRYGVPVHTSMYRNLRINLPKVEVMFPGVPHKDGEDSYVPSEEIVEYLNTYADKYNLRKLCKFYHCVKKICRTEAAWVVTVVDLTTSTEYTSEYDFLFVCNGNNNLPQTAYLDGADTFTGHSMHSHDYRQPEPFTGQRVLIVGGGPSALDLTNHISETALKVYLSHHNHVIKLEKLMLRDNVECKPDVRRMCPNTVEFKDDTVEDIDSVVYCTGYKCNYAFLDESCGITDDEGLVYPLYKHFINANHNSMCILGNMCHSMQFHTFDIQVRFFIKTLTNKNILPAKDSMIQEIQEVMKMKLKDGVSKKTYFHSKSFEDEKYYSELATMADINGVPRVLTQIHARAVSQLFANFPRFRSDKYTIIDDDTFTVSTGI